MKTGKYSDRMDVNIKISLYEYGLIRNPDTDRVIWCLNNGTEEYRENKPIIKTSYITLEDVKEALEEASDGYFSFIGSDKETELRRLHASYLSNTIHSMNQWNGYFNEHLYH